MTKTKLTAAEEKYRAALYRTCEHLLHEAERQARKGKPAPLRILTRAAGRGPKPPRQEKQEEEIIQIDWSGLGRPNRDTDPSAEPPAQKELRERILRYENQPEWQPHVAMWRNELAALEAKHSPRKKSTPRPNAGPDTKDPLQS